MTDLFSSFFPIRNEEIHYEVIGIDCYLNNLSSVFFYFDFLCGGKYDDHAMKYTIVQKDFQVKKRDNQRVLQSHSEERCFFYSPFINHPGLSNIQLKSFFQMCRLESVSFDLEKKFGATFILIDIL